jgi:predicted nucleotidyltransferase
MKVKPEITTKIILDDIINSLSELKEILRSIILLGSFSNKSDYEASDIDLLLVTSKQLNTEESIKIGDKLLRSKIVEPNISFNFFNPVCERCKLVSTFKFRHHIIVHYWDDIKKWLKEHDFIICMWANKSIVIWGDNPFDKKPKPQLNKSLLDPWDGVPGFLKEIYQVLITKNPLIDDYEYERYCRFYMNRISELREFFPEIYAIGTPPHNPIGKKGLIEIGKYFETLEYHLKHLIKNES